jgi:hypothetical protein
MKVEVFVFPLEEDKKNTVSIHKLKGALKEYANEELRNRENEA